MAVPAGPYDASVTEAPRHRGKLAVIGLDGATFRVLDPLRQAGVMPALSRIRERGVETILRSTVPAYTPAAWTSMVSGVNPGRHGIFGFLASTPQEPPLIAHSGLIDAPAIWRYVNDQGARAGVFHVPMTYPPTRVDGFMIAGGLAAGWTDSEMPNFSSDPELGRMVLDMSGGHYPLDTVVAYEKDWRSSATATRLERVQRLRRQVLGRLMERTDPDFVFAVFEGPDRLEHVHYQYIVECSEWYGRPQAAEIRDRARSYFREVDRTIDELADWVGTDGHVVIVSDHGAGPWEKTVNINLLLSEWGFLKLPPVSRFTRLGVIAGAGQRLARGVIPRSLLHAAKARVSRSIRWKESVAFASHVAEQGVHLNERGPFPEGVVSPEEVGRLEAEISKRLFDLADPDDAGPVVDRIILRSQVMRGPHAPRSPNLFPFLRDQRYELSDTIAAASAFTDHRDRPWGYHHSDGIFIAAGPNAGAGRFEPGLEMVDVLPTTLHMAGFAVPEGLDGRVVGGVLSSATASRPVATMTPIAVDDRSSRYPFSAKEETEIEESLRGLGYLE